uniref:Uncharacterized protein n=1 Tax=Rhizophora mucronata TaxID=61149 RepID=A0A2P2KIY3_RHIMU
MDCKEHLMKKNKSFIYNFLAPKVFHRTITSIPLQTSSFTSEKLHCAHSKLTLNFIIK